mmetsp:Transcript_16558/g.38344  ORF Transcript_16558/g.38344 Transcript_16558/m.38344 type:complete len:94 (-) Transcript_16558:210-491(-)
MASLSHSELVFIDKVKRAMGRVQNILHTSKHPQVAPNVEHRYEDLFLLSEFLVNMTLASQLGSFGAAGLTTDQIFDRSKLVGQRRTCHDPISH